MWTIASEDQTRLPADFIPTRTLEFVNISPHVYNASREKQKTVDRACNQRTQARSHAVQRTDEEEADTNHHRWLRLI